MRALIALPLLAIALTACVIGGGANYHFSGKPSWVKDDKADAGKKCDPARGSAEGGCAPSNQAPR